MKFDVRSAQLYAGEERLEDWVHSYLNTGDWANLGLSEGLKLQRRWWIGPVEVDLSALSRVVGPEEGMEYPVDDGTWSRLTSEMAESMTDPMLIPPLIIEYRDGVLSVRDGNKRHGAMGLKGWSRCWALIWYNCEEDYIRHTSPLHGPFDFILIINFNTALAYYPPL